MAEPRSEQAYRGSIDKLIGKIGAARGIDLGNYRRSYLERRVAARLRVVGLHSYRQYADLLDSNPAEYDELMGTITINVTDFFRDKVVWDMLRPVLKQLIEQKRHGRSRTLRVWSAGCSTGEEPYSIAMLLLDLLGEHASDFIVSVTATDLDPDVLAVAERGIYDNERLRHIPPAYQVRFMRKLDAKRFEIAPEVKRLVRFREQSLFEPAPFRVIDLVMCRNVFIYFDREQQERVLENFWCSLTRGGYLVLGRSEKLAPAAAARFEAVVGRERIYRRPTRA
ncbi:MAG: protein-glutamate O-methyltransferase CheR [Coriobacteriia bacterium]|nr:protein-glutamate O-methyltransferase CheR [Coriobacteriia bacterium]